jgi:hypothetical protein
MGVVTNYIAKTGAKAADRIAKLSTLSPEQVAKIAENRDAYLSEMPHPDDETAHELTEKLLAASGIEIFNAYLPWIKDLYLPVEQEKGLNRIYNVRYICLNKWVTDKKENSLEKLVNVYNVLSDEACNIALIFNRTCETTNVYLAVSSKNIETDNTKVNDLIGRLENSLRGNFPGSEWEANVGRGTIPCLDNSQTYSVASVSNIPAEKSEKFISQTIEKVLDGVVPESKKKEYTIILLASPVQDLEERKLLLSEFYSGLSPYSSWQTNFTFTENNATSSMAIFGVNAGVSAGVQNARNQAVTNTDTVTDSQNNTNTDSVGQTQTSGTGRTETDSEGSTDGTSDSTTSTDSSGHTDTHSESSSHSDSSSHSEGSSESYSETEGENSSQSAGVGVYNNSGGSSSSETESWGTNETDTTSHSDSSTTGDSQSESKTRSIAKGVVRSVTKSVTKSIANSTSSSTANSVGKSVAQTLGKAVSKAAATTSGITKSVNFGGNFGANFARSSNVTISVGKNEGITQSFTNYTIKHALTELEGQMKRYEKSTALGMWDFAAYVMSEDTNTANSVAHSYLALTQGEESHLSCAAINTWRGDVPEEKLASSEICEYMRNLRHPVFALNPDIVTLDSEINYFPAIVTATTGLSGKELAFSLNFPTHPISGLPILKCAEFGRNIVSYDSNRSTRNLCIGKVFHMNHTEEVPINLSLDSIASHVFVTGSTGSGKSNTVYKLLEGSQKQDIRFLVIEPAKGEYKNVFGSKGVNVLGTNPKLTPMLRINPFSFPDNIHVFEHMDRLIEIFNVCWPMYAAMPAVLKSAVEKSYEDCGWDLLESYNPYGNDVVPSFPDVARNVKQIIDSSEYDAENKGAYKGSLLTRLKSLSNGINGMLFVNDEIEMSTLFDQNTIVDLSRVGSSETKSLIMGILVLKLQEYRMSSDIPMNSPLRHITVIEEAHNLLKRTSTEQSTDSANLLGKSVEMIANAIAEMRTYGEGFIIADQAPGLLDLSAIRNTNTKIIMRLPDAMDRELVGKSASLDDNQIIELAKLPCGVAAIYQNEWVQPVLCKVDKYDSIDEPYVYQCTNRDKKSINCSDRIRIAELLSRGTRLAKETILTDIRPILRMAEIESSIQVSIMQLLENPPKEPRMTRLAPVMNALFPKIKENVEKVYQETNEESEWTKVAVDTLETSYGKEMDDQTRRDIIQAIMTYYLLSELNRIETLADWQENGGLS